MKPKLTAPTSTEIDPEAEIKAAISHIDNALKEVSAIRAIRLKAANECLRKSLIEY